MPVINTVVNTGGGNTQQASFSVDIEQIPGLIAKYEEAREKLQSIKLRAARLRKIAPPGDDEVSRHMANSIGKLAGDDPGCLSWAVNDAIARLNTQIEQLKAAQRDYQATDEAATPSQA